jgi:hypothetical protein
MYQIIKAGKQGLDGFVQELGSLLVEANMDMEREERSGPQYQPLQAGLYKWMILYFVFSIRVVIRFRCNQIVTVLTENNPR